MKENLDKESTTQTVKAERIISINKTGIDTLSLKLKVFDVGEPQHFTDTCAFYFECDCCSAEIIFNSDSTFYHIEHCLPGDDVTTGTYFQTLNDVTLKYSGKWTGKYYNETYTKGSKKPEYIVKDTAIASEIMTYQLSSCGNKVKLTRSDKKELAISTSSNYYSFLTKLKREGYIKRLENLQK